MKAVTRDRFTKEEIGINVIGLPPHLWSWSNVERIVKKVRDLELLEVDKDYINFDRLDMIRVKISIKEGVRTFKPLTLLME